MSTFKAVFGNIIHGFFYFGNLFVKQLLDKFSNVFWKDLFEFWFTVRKMQFDYNTKIELNPVWYHSQIKVDKKWVFLENGIEKE